MRASDVIQALLSLLDVRRPMYIWGPPGVGKSALIKYVAKKRKLKLVDLRAVLLDPVDLRGLPTVSKQKIAEWCPPSFLPRDGEGILFLDELAQAPPLVQAGCLQLCLDRRIGEYALPDGWTIIAASNRQEDRAGTHKLITPLLNRFIHLDLEVSHEDWDSWALENGIATEVRSFLRYLPGKLHQFDASSGSRAFPTPRSWHAVSDVLPHIPANLLHPVVAGCVGDGPAAEFVGFHRICSDLPNLDDAIKRPQQAAVPREPAVLYAVSGALVEKSRTLDERLLNNLGTYVCRFTEEFTAMTLKDLCKLHRVFSTLPSVDTWLTKNRSLMAGNA